MHDKPFAPALCAGHQKVALRCMADNSRGPTQLQQPWKSLRVHSWTACHHSSDAMCLTTTLFTSIVANCLACVCPGARAAFFSSPTRICSCASARIKRSRTSIMVSFLALECAHLFRAAGPLAPIQLVLPVLLMPTVLLPLHLLPPASRSHRPLSSVSCSSASCERRTRAFNSSRSSSRLCLICWQIPGRSCSECAVGAGAAVEAPRSTMTTGGPADLGPLALASGCSAGTRTGI